MCHTRAHTLWRRCIVLSIPADLGLTALPIIHQCFFNAGSTQCIYSITECTPVCVCIYVQGYGGHEMGWDASAVHPCSHIHPHFTSMHCIHPPSLICHTQCSDNT